VIGLDAEFARRLDIFVRRLQAQQYRVVITDGLRSRVEQERLRRLYEQGRGPRAAKPGQSCHEYGFAVDVVVSPRDENVVYAAANLADLRIITYGTASNHFHVEDAEGCRRAKYPTSTDRITQLPYPQDTAANQRQLPPAAPGRTKGCP
jgi:D-alanyl-D-alanine dipeptidase